MMSSTTRDESIMQFSRNVPIMLKICPFFPQKCPFHTITNTYSTGLAAILHFRAKSEGLGDLIIDNIGGYIIYDWWNDSNLDFLAGLLGILWLASRALDSCWATTTSSSRPAIAAACADWQSTTPFDEHYTCIIPVELPDYSRIMLYAFADRLYSGNYAGILDASLSTTTRG